MSMPSDCDEKRSQCVKFFVDGVEVRKEKFAPFTMYGDETGGPINSRKPPVGLHTIKACTYSDKACTKDESGCKEMEVDFLDCDRPKVPPKIKRLLPLRSIACSTTTEPSHVLLDKRHDTYLRTSPTKETTLQANLGKNYLVMSVRLSYRNLSSTQKVRVLVFNEKGKKVGAGDFLPSQDGTLEIRLKSPNGGGVPKGKKFKIVIPRSRVEVSEVTFWGGSSVSEPSSGKTISWGLAVVVDFANSKLEDYGSGEDAAAINNVNDVRKQLDLMESHWLWMSRGAHQIEWVIERITLDQPLAPNEFQNSWDIFRDTVATKVLNKIRLSHYDLNLDGILDHAWFVLASKNNTDNEEGFFYMIGGRSINKNVDIFVDGQGGYAVKDNCTGCFNHEVAHTKAIGLPDLYGDFNNLGPASIMSYPWGSNPGGLLAFELMKTGWSQPLGISETTEAIVLHPMEDKDGQAVLIKIGDQNEYFMLEYHKQPEVGWGSDFEIDGIVITHIFDSLRHWNTTLNNEDPPLIRIEAADGALQYGEWPIATSFWYPENEAMPEAFIGKLYGQEQGIFRVTSFERVENGISVGVYFL